MHTRGWHDRTCLHIGKCNLGVFPGEVPQVAMCLCVNKLGTSYIRWTRQCILLWLELCAGVKALLRPGWSFAQVLPVTCPRVGGLRVTYT